MKKSMLDRPPIKQEVVQRLALGESQASIAREVGLHPSQVSRFSQREDIKALIEEQTYNLLEVLPDAVGNVKDLVREMRTIPKTEIKRRELSYKASQKVLESAGMLSTPNPSHTVVTIINRNTTIISPAVEKMLHEMRRRTMGIPDPE